MNQFYIFSEFHIIILLVQVEQVSQTSLLCTRLQTFLTNPTVQIIIMKCKQKLCQQSKKIAATRNFDVCENVIEEMIKKNEDKEEEK